MLQKPAGGCMSPPFENRQDVTRQHEGTEHLAINDSWYTRLLVRVALRTTAHLFERKGTCIPITKGKIVKVGMKTHLTEAVTMRFIAENTSVAVPKVHCAFVHKRMAYVVMERIKGERLDTITHDRRHKVCATLKRALKSMRDIPPPPGIGVESCCGGSLTDPRISWAPQRFGSFETIHEFHSWLRQGFTMDAPSTEPETQNESAELLQDLQDLREMISMQDSPWPAPVFTHADLNGGNILVRPDDVPVVIDWECAGWFPTYWEYTTAIWTGHVFTRWPSIVDEFLDPVPSEVVKMENTRNRWWGDF